MKKTKVLIYGDINLNIIDGSAVWLTSIINVIGVNDGIEIDLMLKTPIKSNVMIDSIYNYENINKIEMYQTSNRLTPKEAVENMVKLDEINNYDCIITRGFELSYLGTLENIKSKLVCYVTDFQHDSALIDEQERARLNSIYTNCRFFCAQTPEARECLKIILNIKEDEKFIILNPMIPDYPKTILKSINKNNKLIYSGKFARDWNTVEIIDAFKNLNEVNCEIKLTVVGNLFRADLDEYKESLVTELTNNKNINWIKGVSRIESNRLIDEADIGIAWRSSKVDNDNSVELSTKVLEYCRAGKPIILNRIKMYEKLLGKDYPLFANSQKEFEEKVLLAFSNSCIYKEAAKRVYNAGKKYTFIESYKNIHYRIKEIKNEKIRIVFAGHDLKFLQGFIDFIDNDNRYEIKIDKWRGHNNHDEKYSRECLEWADIIFCEWGLGNTQWYSNNKKPWQKLIVRMHLQERETVYHRQFNYDNIDRIIAISPYIYEEFSYKIKVPREKMTMIYNFIDFDKFNKSKVEGSEFNLGIVGVCPRRKRLDLAIEILNKLVKIDNRYKLFIKGKKPEEYSWVWNKPEERKYYDEVYAKINEYGLINNVVFDGHGNDMEEWFRKIGFCLSTSDFESFHMAPAEGMCSGTVPVIRAWEGSNTIYKQDYIINTVEQAVNYVIEYKDNVGDLEYVEYVKNNFEKNIIFKKIEEIVVGVK